MTPLTRLLTFTLMFLLALLVAASVTRWYVAPPPKSSHPAVERSAESPAAHALLDRGTLALSSSAFLVAVMLMFALGSRGKDRAKGTRAPFGSRERERRSLDLLASTSARAQEALDHERDAREKAQADSQERLQLLNQALEEKIRLGRDLHDGVIQSLYAAGLTLESAQRLASTNSTKATEHFEQAGSLINRGITDIRSYIEGLSPRSVRRDSLRSGLAEAVEQLRAGRPLDVDWKINEKSVADLSDEQLSETLQITREAVSNALRHGGAHRIVISLEQSTDGAKFTIRDDGTGFTTSTTSGAGQGLSNMAARAQAAMGKFELASTPGAGTCIEITWLTALSS